jgi:hypothetical protein
MLTFDEEVKSRKGAVKAYNMFIYFSDSVDFNKLKQLEEEGEFDDAFSELIMNMIKHKFIDKVEIGPISAK